MSRTDRLGLCRAPNALGRAAYLSLTTFRRDGRGVSTPVWFALDGDRKYWYVKPAYEAVLRILAFLMRRKSGGAAYIELRSTMSAS